MPSRMQAAVFKLFSPCEVSVATRFFYPLAGAVILAGCLTGCESNSYQIEMTLHEGQVDRRIAAGRQSGDSPRDLPPAELEHLQKAYGGQSPERVGNALVFRTRTAQQMPSDVGGAGNYYSVGTSLGRFSAYVERFRGSDDLQAQVQDRLEGADLACDLLQQWLDEHCRDMKGYAEVRAFVGGDLRRDYKNLALTLWVTAHGAAAAADGDSTEEATAIRIGQLLMERGYLKPDELPQWGRGFSEANGGKPERLLTLCKQLLARKMGTPPGDPLPEILGILDHPDDMVHELGALALASPKFQAWAKRLGGEPPTDPESAASALLLGSLLPGFDIFGVRDELVVSFATNAQPYLTNGEYDDSEHKVRWDRRISSRREGSFDPITLLYAFWSEPHEDVQQRHFGRLILEDDDLATYCLWHAGLTMAEKAEWDQFISQLAPGEGLVASLQAFRFSHEAPADEYSAANEGVSLIVEKLASEPLADPKTAEPPASR